MATETAEPVTVPGTGRTASVPGTAPSRIRRLGRAVLPGPVPGANGAALYRRWWLPWLWTAPAIGCAVVFGVFPFLNTLLLSFTNAKPLGGAAGFVGLDNYTRMIQDDDFWLATRNSILYAVIVVPLMFAVTAGTRPLKLNAVMSFAGLSEATTVYTMV